LDIKRGETEPTRRRVIPEPEQVDPAQGDRPAEPPEQSPLVAQRLARSPQLEPEEPGGHQCRIADYPGGCQE
jgi:hypothetical protein